MNFETTITVPLGYGLEKKSDSMKYKRNIFVWYWDYLNPEFKKFLPSAFCVYCDFRIFVL